jgi:hypothetical protein
VTERYRHLRRRRPSRGLCVLAAVALALAGCGGSKAGKVATKSAPSSHVSTTQAPPPPVFPLTGLPTNGPPATRPALSIKVDNISNALPQVGLNNADIVTEALVEGGITRLFATFQSQDAAVVGPIRSARPVDADLLDQLGGGLFAYSGAAPGEIAPTEDHGHATLLSNDAGVPAFYRDHSRSAPHNVFASTADLYAAGAEAGDHSPPPPALYRFGGLTGRPPATTVDIPMGQFTDVGWHWTGSLYERDQNGAPDVLDDGAPISAVNVLMMSVGIEGSGVFDVTGVQDPLVVVIGQGPAWLMRDGQLVEGTWTRPTTDAPTVFHDNAGGEMVMHPGRTWVELVPNYVQPTFG